ncbi:agamous-like MADS-box protein AGL103 [Ziziphus jujuba]|uniref:Agamous-like MADS-box protein AGL103 n=1 Tax=Ziziphus jujuba TaxID=326968 RepID=A0A6P6G4M3_ZIZJJ|nr:agamous-like MADS-box protein AGL103 [Ziziphus jujuba]
MLKKCYEFSTLCGIDVCMIIYGPKQIGRPTELVTYPNDSTQVARIIKQFQSTTIYKPPKRIFNLSDIFIDRKRKIDSEISKLRKRYFAAKYPISDELTNSLSRDQLCFLLSRLDAKIEDAKAMIDLRKENHLLLMKNPVGQNYANYVQNIFHDQKPAIPLNHHHHPVMDHMQLPLQVLLNQTTPQMVPPPRFDLNPNLAINNAMNNPVTMMMLMNDQAGPENGASSSNILDNHQFIGSNNHVCGPVFNDPTLGMIDNMMFSNIGGQYSQGVQVQQPMPDIQYNPTVNAAAGIPSQRINGCDEGNRFDDEFSEFLYRNKIL